MLFRILVMRQCWMWLNLGVFSEFTYLLHFPLTYHEHMSLRFHSKGLIQCVSVPRALPIMKIHTILEITCVEKDLSSVLSSTMCFALTQVVLLSGMNAWAQSLSLKAKQEGAGSRQLQVLIPFSQSSHGRTHRGEQPQSCSIKLDDVFVQFVKQWPID